MIASKLPNWFRILLAALVLPNLPMWIARPLIQTPLAAGFFNIDYVMAVLITVFGFPVLGACVLVAGLACDALRTFDVIFHFSQQDFFYCASYVTHLPFWLVARNLGLLAAGATVIVILWRKLLQGMQVRPNRKIAVAVLLCTFLLKAVDTLNGANRYVTIRETQIGHTLVAESTLSVMISVGRMFQGMVPNTPIESAIAPLRAAPVSYALPAAQETENNVVLILVESMGYAEHPDRSYLDVFQRPTLASRYYIETGKIPYYGSTVAGEYRELCGLRTGAHIGAAELSHRDECLPAFYNRNGYETQAIHGYQGRMFARQSWYPALGFQRSTFLEQLSKLPTMNLCEGAFPGICDADVARYIGSELKRPGKKKFIHWMTLNTHLPIPRSKEGEQECASARENDVCQLELLLRRTSLAIADLADDPSIPPTEFIVVGDHPPPFATLSRREQFDQEQVPFVRLVPRTARPTGTALASSWSKDQHETTRKLAAKLAQ